jgi:hypothetical protein
LRTSVPSAEDGAVLGRREWPITKEDVNLILLSLMRVEAKLKAISEAVGADDGEAEEDT